MNTRSRGLMLPGLLCIGSAVIIFLRLAPSVTPHLRQAELDILVVPFAGWLFIAGIAWWILNFSGKSVRASLIFLLVLGPPAVMFVSCTAVYGPPDVHATLNSRQELLSELSIKSNCHYRLYYFNNGLLVSDTLCLRKEREYGLIVLQETLWWLDEGPHSARLVTTTRGQAAVQDGTSLLHVFTLGA